MKHHYSNFILVDIFLLDFLKNLYHSVEPPVNHIKYLQPIITKQIMRRIPILLILIITLTHQYALEGAWKLTNQQELELSQKTNINFKFDREVNSQNNIQYDLKIQACRMLFYRYQVRGRNIFFRFVSLGNIVRECEEKQINIIRTKMDTIFYFTINKNTLQLFNPAGMAQFQLQRKVKSITSVNGLWQSLRVSGKPYFADIYMNGTHAVLCDGEGIANYKIRNNRITFIIQKSRGCSDFDVLIGLDDSSFFRIKDGNELILVDNGLHQTLVASWIENVPKDQPIQFKEKVIPEETKIPTIVVQPEEPKTPTEVVQPEEPKTPTEVAQPEEPKTPTEVVKPEEPKTPTEVVKPEEPKTPTEEPKTPTEVAQPEEPKTPTEEPKTPTEVAQPEEPKTPTEEPKTPTEVAQPEEPKTPTEEPKTPTEVAQPEEPKTPTEEPKTPTEVAQPEEPKTPTEEPKTPTEVAQPEEPKTPTEEPKTPTEVAQPEEPKTPTEEPKTPTEVAQPEEPKTPTEEPKTPTEVAQPEEIIPLTPQITIPVKQEDQPIQPEIQEQANVNGQISKVQESIQENSIAQPVQKKQPESEISPIEIIKSKRKPSELRPLEAKDIQNTKWVLKSIGDQDILPFEAQYYIVNPVNTARVVLYGGCNVQFSSFNLNGNEISFGPVAATRRACPNNDDSLVVQPLFKNGKYVEIRGKMLTMYDKDMNKAICFVSAKTL